MKLKKLLEELKETEGFKEFKTKHPGSFLTAGFFMIGDLEKDGDSFQIDFFIPELEKMASFEYPFTKAKIHDDEIKNRKEIKNLDLKIDVLNLKENSEKIFEKSFGKIIGIIQNDEWNITCVDGMDIKRLRLNPYTEEIIHKDNLNLTDMIKIKKTSKPEQ